jgi:hypothetical protein
VISARALGAPLLLCLWLGPEGDPWASRALDACDGGTGGEAAASGIVLTQTDGRTELSDDAPTDYVDVELGRCPDGEIALSVTSEDARIVAVQPALLRFTSDDWDHPQVVTVTLQGDPRVDAPVRVALSVGIAEPGEDRSYRLVEDAVVYIDVRIGWLPARSP